MTGDISVDALGADDLSEVGGWIAAHGYWPKRGYRYHGTDLVGEDIDDARAAFGAAEAGGDDVQALAARADGRLVGAAVLRRLPFDSDHFGVDTWALERVVTATDGDERLATVAAICRTALAAGQDLTVYKPDAEDAYAVAGAQQAGMDVYNSLVVWLTTQAHLPTGDLPPVDFEMRFFTSEAPIDLDESTKERFVAEAAQVWDGHRFHVDPHISTDRAVDMYARWCRMVLDDEWADYTFIGLDDDGPFMLVAYQYLPGHGADDPVRILGETFGMLVRNRGVGRGAAPYDAIIAGAPADFIEHPTQLLTTPLMKMLPRRATFLRGNQVMHGWAPRLR